MAISVFYPKSKKELGELKKDITSYLKLWIRVYVVTQVIMSIILASLFIKSTGMSMANNLLLFLFIVLLWAFLPSLVISFLLAAVISVNSKLGKRGK